MADREDFATAVGALIKGRSPVGHAHVVGDVTGLVARLAALEYDSGLRDATALAGANLSSGTILLRRVGPIVTLELDSVTPAAGYGSGGTFFTVPAGFRRRTRLNFSMPTARAATVWRSAFVFSAGGLGIWSPSTSDSWTIALMWITDDTPPTTPPGNPA